MRLDLLTRLLCFGLPLGMSRTGDRGGRPYIYVLLDKLYGLMYNKNAVTPYKSTSSPPPPPLYIVVSTSPDHNMLWFAIQNSLFWLYTTIYSGTRYKFTPCRYHTTTIYSGRRCRQKLFRLYNNCQNKKPTTAFCAHAFYTFSRSFR
jgi:hypothetical protein